MLRLRPPRDAATFRTSPPSGRAALLRQPGIFLTVLLMALPAGSLLAAGVASATPTSVPLPGTATSWVALGGLYMPSSLELGAPLAPSANVAGSLAFAPSNTQGLETIATDQSNPSSPLYHEYLKGNTYDQLFGPDAARQQALQSYLSAHDLTVSVVSDLLWNVRGSAQAMDSAFDTTFVSAYAPGGQHGWAPATPMKLPGSLAQDVSPTGAFQNALSAGHPDLVRPDLAKVESHAQAPKSPHQLPELSLWNWNGYVVNYTAYGYGYLVFPPTLGNISYQLNITGGAPPYQVNWNWGDGTVQNTATNSSKITLVHTYYNPYGSDDCSACYYITVTVTDSAGNVNTLNDSVLPGMSPEGAQLLYNEAPLLAQDFNGAGTSIGIDDMCDPDYATAQYTVDFNAFSAAYGLPVASASTFDIIGSGDTDANCANNGGGVAEWSGETLLDIEFSHAMAPGAKIVLDLSASALQEGDATWDTLSNGVFISSNSWGCSYNASAQGGCGVYWPVFDQAAVQGQTFMVASGDCGAIGMLGTDPPTDSPAALGVGGTDPYAYPSGVFRTEFAWNGSTDATCDQTGANDDGSTGGFSNNDGGWNTSSIAAPWYQTGMSGFTGTFRGVPDVSAIGGTFVTNYYEGAWGLVAGTSLASPSWAGMLDVMYSYNASGSKANGLANYDLYLIAEGADYAPGFHDILVGNNMISTWGNFGYSCGPGWSAVTGLGSPNVGNLAQILAGQNGNSHATDSLSVVLAANVTDIPEGYAVNFGADAAGGSATFAAYSYAWTFGDGGLATTGAYQTTHVYSTPGNYPATVKVTVGANSATSNTVMIHVNGPAPLAVFAGSSVTNGFAPLAVNFNALTTGGSGTIATWAWHLGLSGATASTQSPSYTYTKPGTYTVWVNATDSLSNTAQSNVFTITVLAPLVIAASASTVTGTAPLTVDFTSTVSGGISPYTAFSWHFGDGQTAATQDAKHAYATAGTFYAWSNVTDSLPETAMSNVLVITVANAPPPTLAITSFTASPATLTVGSTTTLDVVATGGTPPYAYAYTGLPGGCTSSSTASLPCTPTATGSFTVTVTLTDSGVPAQNAHQSLTLTVNAKPTPLTVTLNGWSAATAGSSAPTYHANPAGGSGSYSSFTWWWNDTTTSSSLTPTATATNVTTYDFPDAGTYTVVVAVVDSAGNAAHSSSITVTVSAATSTTPPSSSTASGNTLLGISYLYWAVIGVVVVLAIVAVAVLSRRKQAPPPMATPGPASWSSSGTAPMPPPPTPGTMEPAPPPPPTG